MGGFPDIDSALEAIKAKDSKEKYTILTLAVKRLFNTIGTDDILRIKEGQWLYRGRILPQEQVKLLKAEATALLSTKLWEILKNELWYQANRKLFLESKSEIDMAAGKLWTYSIDTILTKLNRIVEEE